MADAAGASSDDPDAGFVRALCVVSGVEQRVPLAGISTASALVDAVCRVFSVDAATRDVVYVHAAWGEAVLEGDAELEMLGVRGVDEQLEVRVSAQGAARIELAHTHGLTAGDHRALALFAEALDKEDWTLARGLAVSGWLATARVMDRPTGATALHVLCAFVQGYVGERSTAEAAAAELAGIVVGSGADVNARCKSLGDTLFAMGLHDVSFSSYDFYRREDLTPLHAAACCGAAALLHVLLRHGADVNAQCKGGATPCYFAVSPHPRLMASAPSAGEAATGLEPLRLLIEAGADLEISSEKGMTPCFFAAWTGRAEALQMLVDAGADVNAANSAGCSPCFAAAEQGHVDALRVLLRAGANVNKATHDGRKAVFLHSRDSEIAQALISAGADESQPCMIL